MKKERKTKMSILYSQVQCQIEDGNAREKAQHGCILYCVFLPLFYGIVVTYLKKKL